MKGVLLGVEHDFNVRLLRTMARGAALHVIISCAIVKPSKLAEKGMRSKTWQMNKYVNTIPARQERYFIGIQSPKKLKKQAEPY